MTASNDPTQNPSPMGPAPPASRFSGEGRPVVSRWPGMSRRAGLTTRILGATALITGVAIAAEPYALLALALMVPLWVGIEIEARRRRGGRAPAVPRANHS